jgi:hypothetical protein
VFCGFASRPAIVLNKLPHVRTPALQMASDSMEHADPNPMHPILICSPSKPPRDDDDAAGDLFVAPASAFEPTVRDAASTVSTTTSTTTADAAGAAAAANGINADGGDESFEELLKQFATLSPPATTTTSSTTSMMNESGGMDAGTTQEEACPVCTTSVETSAFATHVIACMAQFDEQDRREMERRDAELAWTLANSDGFTESLDVMQAVAFSFVTSGDGGGGGGSSTGGGGDAAMDETAPAAATTTATTTKLVCGFGVECARTNPRHFAAVAHPHEHIFYSQTHGGSSDIDNPYPTDGMPISASSTTSSSMSSTSSSSSPAFTCDGCDESVPCGARFFECTDAQCRQREPFIALESEMPPSWRGIVAFRMCETCEATAVHPAEHSLTVHTADAAASSSTSSSSASSSSSSSSSLLLKAKTPSLYVNGQPKSVTSFSALVVASATAGAGVDGDDAGGNRHTKRRKGESGSLTADAESSSSSSSSSSSTTSPSVVKKLPCRNGAGCARRDTGHFELLQHPRVECPLCSQLYEVYEVDGHVTVCLKASARQSAFAAARSMSSSSQPHTPSSSPSRSPSSSQSFRSSPAYGARASPQPPPSLTMTASTATSTTTTATASLTVAIPMSDDPATAATAASPSASMAARASPASAQLTRGQLASIAKHIVGVQSSQANDADAANSNGDKNSNGNGSGSGEKSQSLVTLLSSFKSLGFTRDALSRELKKVRSEQDIAGMVVPSPSGEDDKDVMQR